MGISKEEAKFTLGAENIRHLRNYMQKENGNFIGWLKKGGHLAKKGSKASSNMSGYDTWLIKSVRYR